MNTNNRTLGLSFMMPTGQSKHLWSFQLISFMPETLNNFGLSEERGLTEGVLTFSVITSTQEEELHAYSKAEWLLTVPSCNSLFLSIIYTCTHLGTLWNVYTSCHVCMQWAETFSFFLNKSFWWENPLVDNCFSVDTMLFSKEHTSPTHLGRPKQWLSFHVTSASLWNTTGTNLKEITAPLGSPIILFLENIPAQS